jgi:hypothetical protein
LQRDNPFGPRLKAIIEHPGIPVGISTMTLAETLAGPAKLGDELTMLRIRSGLKRLPAFAIAPFDEETASVAAWIRGQTGLKLPDAGVIASARQAKAVCIVGNDLRWRNKEIGIRFVSLNEFAGVGMPDTD